MKKQAKRLLKGIISVIVLIALFLFVVSIWASVYTFVYDHILLTMLVSAGILAFFIILGFASWKKIKRKITDIFT